MSDVPLVIIDNIYFLEQGKSVLSKMRDDAYTCTQVPFELGGIGRHFRHVLDHYALFWKGFDGGVINYDDRERDIEIEHKRRHAVLLFETIKHDLSNWAQTQPNLDRTLRVWHNGTWCQSSVGRELQHLINHTVHHYAFVALILGVLDEDVEDGFGVAPSTLAAQMAQ